jgi:hypothetical protein
VVVDAVAGAERVRPEFVLAVRAATLAVVVEEVIALVLEPVVVVAQKYLQRVAEEWKRGCSVWTGAVGKLLPQGFQADTGHVAEVVMIRVSDKSAVKGVGKTLVVVLHSWSEAE